MIYVPDILGIEILISAQHGFAYKYLDTQIWKKHDNSRPAEIKNYPIWKHVYLRTEKLWYTGVNNCILQYKFMYNIIIQHFDWENLNLQWKEGVGLFMKCFVDTYSFGKSIFFKGKVKIKYPVLKKVNAFPWHTRALFCENTTGTRCHCSTESAQNQNCKPCPRKRWLGLTQ